MKEKIVEKAKAIVTEEDLKNLIQQEIVPLMKKYNVNFSEKELLEYEEETLKKLSKEDLDDVSGGVSIKSALLTGGILSMALLGGVSLAPSIASAESGKGALIQTDGKGQQQGDGNEEEEEEEASVSEDDSGDKLEGGFFYACDNNGFRYECCNFETFFNHFKAGKHGLGEVKEDTLREIDWTAFEDKIFISLDGIKNPEKWSKRWKVPATLNVNGATEKVGGITCENSERINIRKLSLDEDIDNFIFDNYCFNLSWGWMTIDADDEEKVSKLEEADFSNVTGQLVLGQYAFSESKIKSAKYSQNLGNLVVLGGSFCNSELENLYFTAEKLYFEDGAFSNIEKAKKVEFSNNCKDVKIKGKALFGAFCGFNEVNVPVCNFTSGPEENDGESPVCEATINYPQDFNGDFNIKQGNRGLFRIAGTINCPQNVNNFVVEDEALSKGLGIGNNLTNFVTPEKIHGSTKIGRESFSQCKIDSFNIDDCDGDINVDNNAFEYTKLKSVNFNSNSGNINIGPKTFSHNKQLEEINFSASHDINIDKEAFYDCENIKKINIYCKGNANIDISVFYNLSPDLEINIRAKNLSFKIAEKIYEVDAENYLWEKDDDGEGSTGRRFCEKVVFNGFDFTVQDLLNNKFKIDSNNERQKALRTSLEIQFNNLEPKVLKDSSPELRTEWVQAKNSNRLAIFGDQEYIIKPDNSGRIILNKLVYLPNVKEYNYPSNGVLQDGSMVKVEEGNYLNFIKDHNQIERINIGPGVKEISFESDMLKNNKDLTNIDLSNSIDLEQVNCGPNAFKGTAITSFWFPKQDVRFNAGPSAFAGTPIATFAAPSKGFFFSSSESLQDQATRALNCLKSCNNYRHLFNSILDKNSIKNLATVLNNVESNLSVVKLTPGEREQLTNAAELIKEYVE